MPSSSQIRNALAYMAVTVLVLVFLNIYSASASRDLMFKAKCSSAQDKLKVVTSSFSGVDALTQETAEQIISVIGDMNVTRLIVTDASGRALYDSVPSQNAEGKFVLLEPIVQALDCKQHAQKLRCVAGPDARYGRWVRISDGIRCLAGRHYRKP